MVSVVSCITFAILFLILLIFFSMSLALGLSIYLPFQRTSFGFIDFFFSQSLPSFISILRFVILVFLLMGFLSFSNLFSCNTKKIVVIFLLLLFLMSTCITLISLLELLLV